MILHWLRTAIDTYLLHPLHGNGYQWWSGAGSGSPIFTAVVVWLVRHNCHAKGCWRMGRRAHGDLVLCHRHHPSAQPSKADFAGAGAAT